MTAPDYFSTPVGNYYGTLQCKRDSRGQHWIGIEECDGEVNGVEISADLYEKLFAEIGEPTN